MTKKIEYKKYIEWWQNGALHRENGPAREWVNGDKEWFLNGLHHREDGPAIEFANGSKAWYFNGVRHREDRPAVEHADGSIFWLSGGKYHREDGPAVEYPDGHKEWWMNGYHINDIKLDLTRKYINCVGQFIFKDYLILCFERGTYYFYMVLWKDVRIEGKRYDCKLAKLKSML